MNRRSFALTAAAAASPLARSAPQARLARRDSFFGIHLDLHPQATDTELGKDVSDAMVERFCDLVKPDYVQYDCKGHAGWLGYPSRVSRSSPGIVQDSLAIWRRVTREKGVALYIHFSGVWDSLAIEEHPEWARGRADGAREDRQASTFGPYADERMIPQLLEVSEKYDLDGVWVDGECWATHPDYSAPAARAWGARPMPKSAADSDWQEFLEFNREQFRKYVRHYVETVRKQRPGFQIASNWLYSTYVPERPDLPVDFLSGDYLGNAALGHARLEARYLAQTGKPWDLMAWGFQQPNSNPLNSPIHKPAVQLMQEAGVVLAQGGGFQIYYQPARSGRIDERYLQVMARVAKFCRDRQAIAHQSESVPQIGVVFSRHSLYRTAGKLFGGWGNAANPAQGCLEALLELHYSVDVLPDWKLGEIARQYPLIVVPDWPDLGVATRDILLDYAQQGGKLIVIGAENVALFRDSLGIRLRGDARDQNAWLPMSEVFANARGRWQDVELVGANPIAMRHATYDSQRPGAVAAFRQGSLIGAPGPLGQVFASTHTPALREFFGALVAPLFTPLVRLTAPPTVEVSLRRKKGQMILHLLNATAQQVAGSHAVVDFIPPVGPITIEYRGRKRTIPQLLIHEAIRLEV